MAEITAPFGPDGAGKSHYTEHRQAADPEALVLPGTNLEAWPGMLFEYDLELHRPPAVERIEGRVLYIANAIRELHVLEGVVIVDGPTLHKTMAKRAADGQAIQELVNQLGFEDVLAMMEHVSICPREASLENGQTLQERIDLRGERSRWGPPDARASQVQIDAYHRVEDWLRDRGFDLTLVDWQS